ncbi:MAG: hypothetical protein SVR08_16295 [Spirochaetota bacterium]|nr:hypothetical protein [Spirochaetota bacterium]
MTKKEYQNKLAKIEQLFRDQDTYDYGKSYYELNFLIEKVNDYEKEHNITNTKYKIMEA